MTETSPATTPNGHQLIMRADSPDIRDRWYEPALVQLEREIHPLGNLNILDQGSEGACTGFGLAAVINMLNNLRNSDVEVSTRMLYEMARQYDEWPGEDYEGSSCRGAIRGWYNMGVCSEQSWPYSIDGNHDSDLTVDRAKEARENTIGAYYRLRHNIVDFHAALNETGVLYVSAQVHSGWWPDAISGDGAIPFRQDIAGGHAFAIVGYNQDGFWIQNSWGDDWGRNGLALWTYEDWQANIQDGWVLRLALPTPQIWHLPVRSASTDTEQAGRAPSRGEIAGHFVHLDDGNFHTHGRYSSSLHDVQQTANQIKISTSYKHLLLYAHGGLNSTKDSAKRISSMKQVFKDNGIYPFHFMYDTGLMEELKDIIFGKKKTCVERAGGFTDWTDKLLEKATRVPGRALWREMKGGATKPFCHNHAGTQTINTLISAAETAGIQLHFAGHSTGAILMGNLLKSAKDQFPALRVKSGTLLAPACTTQFFKDLYIPELNTGSGFGIDQLSIYNLTETQEEDDNVAKIYRKSLLYLVSRSFEENPVAPILGMKKYKRRVQLPSSNHEFIYSTGKTTGTSRCKSTSHGGFDNDPDSMNDMLKRILGNDPIIRPFTQKDLDY